MSKLPPNCRSNYVYFGQINESVCLSVMKTKHFLPKWIRAY